MKKVTLTPNTWTVGGMGPSSEGQPVKFTGEVIAEETTNHMDAHAWNSWTLYRTEGGNFVLLYEHNSLWPGSRGYEKVKVFDSLDDIPTYDPAEMYDEPGEAYAIPVSMMCEAREAMGEDPAIHID